MGKDKNIIPLSHELIAPCGMNCGICSYYLAHANNLNRSQCAGCRPSNKKCTYLFGKCSGINSSLNGNKNAKFCSDCDQYPCKEINRMDKRYRDNYKMSVIDNLEVIEKEGIDELLHQQYEKYQCTQCIELTSIHNGQCFKCDNITKLVDKDNL